MLYQLEGYALEWAAPVYSQVSLTVVRGVKGSPEGNSFKYLDDIKNPDSQEVNTSIITRTNNKGDK